MRFTLLTKKTSIIPFIFTINPLIELVRSYIYCPKTLQAHTRMQQGVRKNEKHSTISDVFVCVCIGSMKGGSKRREIFIIPRNDDLVFQQTTSQIHLLPPFVCLLVRKQGGSGLISFPRRGALVYFLSAFGEKDFGDK